MTTRLEEMRAEHGLTKADLIKEAIELLARIRSSPSSDMADIWRRSEPGQFIPTPTNTIASVDLGRIPLKSEAEGLRSLSEIPLSISSIVIPGKGRYAGRLIKAIPMVWDELVQSLRTNWQQVYSMPPERLEEIVALAFNKAGYEVTLTPRSRDHGRDVIAISRGVGCIKIIGSVKRYAPGRMVGYDDVRALLGVLSGEPDSSKALLATTSGFPPHITEDPFIRPFLPTRLELMNGQQLLAWLTELSTPPLISSEKIQTQYHISRQKRSNGKQKL
jgi:restriction system protein